MNLYNWFFIFNADEFAALDLVSKTYTVILAGVGQKDVLVTQGVGIGITYEGVFLPLNLNGKNPFGFETFASYIDAENNVWLGVPVEN